MHEDDQEVEYLTEEDIMSVSPEVEACAGIVLKKDMPKYWQDPRWEKFSSLYADGYHNDAASLALQIRREWSV